MRGAKTMIEQFLSTPSARRATVILCILICIA